MSADGCTTPQHSRQRFSTSHWWCKNQAQTAMTGMQALISRRGGLGECVFCNTPDGGMQALTRMPDRAAGCPGDTRAPSIAVAHYLVCRRTWRLQRRLRICTLLCGSPGRDAAGGRPHPAYEGADVAVIAAVLTQQALRALPTVGCAALEAALAAWLRGLAVGLRAHGLSLTSPDGPPFVPDLLHALHALLRALHGLQPYADADAALCALWASLWPLHLLAALYPRLSSWDTHEVWAFERHSLSKVVGYSGGKVGQGRPSMATALSHTLLFAARRPARAADACTALPPPNTQAALVLSGAGLFLLDAPQAILVVDAAAQDDKSEPPHAWRPPRGSALRAAAEAAASARLPTPALEMVRGVAALVPYLQDDAGLRSDDPGVPLAALSHVSFLHALQAAAEDGGRRPLHAST